MKAGVLYVDDEEDNLVVFKARLKKYFDVFTASSADEGLVLLGQHNNICVVVSDQRMPGTTGVQFLEIVRRRFPRVSRLMLSAYADPGDIIDAVNKGAIYSYIRKPWNGEELRQLIEKCISDFLLKKKSSEVMQEMYSLLAEVQKSVGGVETELDESMQDMRDILARLVTSTSSEQLQELSQELQEGVVRIEKIIRGTIARAKAKHKLAEDEQVSRSTFNNGYLDEEILFVLQRFPHKQARIHRLYFHNEEFRSLCLDYFECSNALNSIAGNNPADEESYRILQGDLERELSAFLSQGY